MTITRREFVTRASAAALTTGLITQTGLAKAAMRAIKPKKILFLGGTGFLGPAVIDILLAQGHEVTLFNRGRRSDDLYPDLEMIVGNRIVDEGPGLTPLQDEVDKGRTWDCVIDTASVHTWTINTAKLLKDAAEQYLYVSSLSAYADNSEHGLTEDSDNVAEMPDEEADQIDRLPYNMQHYGAVKVRSERAAEAYFPGRATVVRPGLIVGPRDFSNRFTYWPWRVRQGGEVLAPGAPDHRVMFTDVRDVAKFMVKLINDQNCQIFNVNGPVSRDMTIGKLLQGCRKTLGSNATFTYADGDWLAEREVHNWAQMPVWINPTDEMKGFHSKSTGRAIEAGFTTRPLSETVTATLAWFDDEFIPRMREQGQVFQPGVNAPGISVEREVELLREWHEHLG